MSEIILNLLHRFARWLKAKTCRHCWELVLGPDGRWLLHPTQDGYQVRLRCRTCDTYFIRGEAVASGQLLIPQNRRGTPEIEVY